MCIERLIVHSPRTRSLKPFEHANSKRLAFMQQLQSAIPVLHDVRLAPTFGRVCLRGHNLNHLVLKLTRQRAAQLPRVM